MFIEKTVDRDSQQKLYVQMFSIVKEKIESREWPYGTQIPTEDELCRTYSVSKATVRMAISDLVRSGYVRKQQGKGTFVLGLFHDPGIAMKTRLTEDLCAKPFYDLIQEKGERKIFKVVQTIEVSEVTGDGALLLRVPERTPALLLHRLLIGSDSCPIAYTRLLGIGTQYKIQTEFERIK